MQYMKLEALGYLLRVPSEYSNMQMIYFLASTVKMIVCVSIICFLNSFIINADHANNYATTFLVIQVDVVSSASLEDIWTAFLEMEI